MQDCREHETPGISRGLPRAWSCKLVVHHLGFDGAFIDQCSDGRVVTFDPWAHGHRSHANAAIPPGVGIAFGLWVRDGHLTRAALFAGCRADKAGSPVTGRLLEICQGSLGRPVPVNARFALRQPVWTRRRCPYRLCEWFIRKFVCAGHFLLILVKHRMRQTCYRSNEFNPPHKEDEAVDLQMVPGARLELARPCGQRILSP